MGRRRGNLGPVATGADQTAQGINRQLVEVEAAFDGAAFGGKGDLSRGDTVKVPASLAAQYITAGIAKSPGTAAAEDLAAQAARDAELSGEQSFAGQQGQSIEFIQVSASRDDESQKHFQRLEEQGRYSPPGEDGVESGVLLAGGEPPNVIRNREQLAKVAGAQEGGSGDGTVTADAYDDMTVEQLKKEHAAREELSGHSGKNRQQLLEDLRDNDAQRAGSQDQSPDGTPGGTPEGQQEGQQQ